MNKRLVMLALAVGVGVAGAACAAANGIAAPAFTVTHTSGVQMRDWMTAQDAAPAATLVDGTSATGRAYGARTTPHMYVVDPAGTLIYQGAIDDKRSANPADAKTAHNYVGAALAEALAGKPVSVANTTPYGCSVKY